MALSFEDAPKGSTFDRKIPPEGTTCARIVQIVDLGVQDRPAFQGQEKSPCHQLHITFELVDELDDFGGEQRPHWLSRTVNFSNDERSALFQYKQAIDKDAKSVADLMDKPCMVTITHKEHKSKVYANITNVTSTPRSLKVKELSNPPRLFDMDDGDVDAFAALPEWLQNTIRSAHNFEQTALGKALSKNKEAVEEEEEIPF